MRLYTNPASPFGRKVKVLAHETGLFEHLELLDEVLTPVAPSDAVSAANPLGKIPCLVTEDGMALYDSRVICEYLDGLHGGRPMFPAEGSFALAGADLAGTGRRHHGCGRCHPLRDLPPARGPTLAGLGPGPEAQDRARPRPAGG